MKSVIKGTKFNIDFLKLGFRIHGHYGHIQYIPHSTRYEYSLQYTIFSRYKFVLITTRHIYQVPNSNIDEKIKFNSFH